MVSDYDLGSLEKLHSEIIKIFDIPLDFLLFQVVSVNGPYTTKETLTIN
jgi:hypothetical protein